MKKLLVVPLLIVAFLAQPAQAACTYSTTGDVATCTATTESAPTLATEGRPLDGLKGLTVIVTSTGTMTAGGTFQAYLYHPVAGWARAPDLDLTAQALTAQAWPGFVVTVPAGRIDFKPTGTGANTTTIYMVGAAK